MARRGHPIFDVILDKLAPSAGETIVDLRCGLGPALHALHDGDPSLQLLGLDVSSEAVAAVRAGLPAVRTGVDEITGALRSASTASVRDATWSTDRRASAARWNELEPHAPLDTLVAWLDTPPHNRSQIRRFLHEPVARVVRAFKEEIGLWTTGDHVDSPRSPR